MARDQVDMTPIGSRDELVAHRFLAELSNSSGARMGPLTHA